MSEISRRDFLDGFALAIAAGLTPAMQVAAQPSRYPPALTPADMREVNRSYEANLQIVKQVRSMLGMTIDLLKGT